jgi:hypothetical protein
MRHSTSLHQTVNFSNSVQHQLNMYVLAASTAGISVLALPLPAQARIIYTPTHRHIGPHQMLPLDLNHDGKPDFVFKDTLSTTSASFFHSGRLSILPHGGNQIWGHKINTGLHYASALAAGVTVGPNGAFSSGSRSMAYGRQEGSSFYCEGKWNNAVKRYLGLKFVIGGKIHFGWARLSVTCNAPHISALLTGYAYESIPNKPIITGKTRGPDVSVEHGALGALALGRK